MKMVLGFLVSFSLLFLELLAAAGPQSDGKPTPPDSMVNWEKRAAEQLEQQRMVKNEVEFHLLRLVDSVGWKKVLAIRQSHQNMDQLEKEQLQRKTAAMISFCDERRFSRQVEVDSLEEMTSEERTFCKSRLKLVNPLMP